METKDQSHIDTDNQPVFSLSELSQAIKRSIESFDTIRVRAEIAECRQWSSGHIYFKLKDDNNILEAVIWKNMVPRIAMKPEDGLDVIITGKLTTFSRQSRYQIVVQSLEMAGEGAFLKQLEERRKRLLAEGLFDPDRKKPLPILPRVIGVVTSPKGAVIRDILHRLNDRFPVHVLVWPVLVQGNQAATEIAQAVTGFNRLAPDGDIPRPDLLIVGRGGGSLEDLMPFNEENVVRAVAASDIPVISAVGHETDHTLCDLAADLRAPTPTAAAEMATPVRNDLLRQCQELALRMDRKTDQIFQNQGEGLRGLVRALGDPEQTISFRQQRLDAAEDRQMRVMTSYLSALFGHIASLADRLPTPAAQIADVQNRAGQIMLRLDRAHDQMAARLAESLRRQGDKLPDPQAVLSRKQHQIDMIDNRMAGRQEQMFERITTRLDQLSRLLDASSYQKVLARGFALVSDAGDGRILKTAEEAKTASDLTLAFADGSIAAKTDNGKAMDKARAKDNNKKTGNDKNTDPSQQGKLL
ncbi:MAG: exodeoxyribonuclease VII large subunit [Alphaproteobacteria bacterium]|nr:exodeoxyribonuclease VII large subunit [Alphaproteobacteria bacterium]